MEDATVSLSSAVLDWAATNAGSRLNDFAKRISKRRAEQISHGMLTPAEAIKFAKAAGIPLGYLFLQQPPAPRVLPVADFRTLRESHPLGRDFFDVFDDIEYKQFWYREYLLAAGADPLPFVGKFKGQHVSAKVVANNMRDVLGLVQDATKHLRSVDEHFGMLARLCEDAGVLVFKNGVVGNNTRRPLSVQEFRGFAIADPIAPCVFINGADAPAAWVFTLAHELAHIWMGDSAISDASPATRNSHERFSNAVAGELLVPAESFRQLWVSGDGDTTRRIEQARRHFRVSTLVIARRALELRIISRDHYKTVYGNAVQHAKKKGEGGGDFYNVLATRNSKKLSKRVAALAVAQAISLTEAGRLLNTNPNNVIKLHARQKTLSV